MFAYVNGLTIISLLLDYIVYSTHEMLIALQVQLFYISYNLILHSLYNKIAITYDDICVAAWQN